MKVIQLKFISKEISHIKNGYAMQGTKAGNLHIMTIQNVI